MDDNTMLSNGAYIRTNTKLNHMTDKEMVYGIKAGNRDAYAGLVISYYKELYDLA